MKRHGSKILLLGVVCLTLICFSVMPVMANPNEEASNEATTEVDKDDKDKIKPPCVKGFKEEYRCADCHTQPNMLIKEARPNEALVYPNFNMELIGDVGYYYLTLILDVEIREFFNYLDLHNIHKAVIEIHTPGGSLFAASRIIGYMRDWSAKDNSVETRLYGIAASAGFAIFVSGDMGKRFTSPIAECMWHELITGEFFAIKSPADKEDEALVLRHLQDTTNNWIVSRSDISKDVLDEKIRKKEFWVNGREAVEFGFADGLIGE